MPFRVQGSDIALVRRAPARAPKKRADTQVCPYRGLRLESQFVSHARKRTGINRTILFEVSVK